MFKGSKVQQPAGKALLIVIPDLIRDPEVFLTQLIFWMSLSRVKAAA
jgi:hypothetical protein